MDKKSTKTQSATANLYLASWHDEVLGFMTAPVLLSESEGAKVEAILIYANMREVCIHEVIQ